MKKIKDLVLQTMKMLEDEDFTCSEIDKDSWILTKGDCCVQLSRMFTKLKEDKGK